MISYGLMGDLGLRQMRPKFEADMTNFKAHVEAEQAARPSLVGNPLRYGAISSEAIVAAVRESLLPA